MSTSQSIGGVGVNERFEAAAAEREQKRAEKQAREEEKARKEAAEKRRREKAEKEAHKLAEKNKSASSESEKLKALEAKLMPLVKRADGMLSDGDVTGAIALYQEAMTGFRGAGAVLYCSFY
eukprot:SAG31_NODE_4716_length_3011_cov_1.958791_2_plen_122_part_00